MAPEASEPVLEPPPARIARLEDEERVALAAVETASRAVAEAKSALASRERHLGDVRARLERARRGDANASRADSPPGITSRREPEPRGGEGCAPAASSPRDPERPDPGPSSASPGIPGPSSPRVTRRRPRRPPRHSPPPPLVRAGQGAYYPDGAQPRASLDAVGRFLLGETIATHVDKAVGRDGDGPAKRKHVQRLVEETWRRPACAPEMWRALGRRFADASTSSIVALRIVAVAHEVARRGSPAALASGAALSELSSHLDRRAARRRAFGGGAAENRRGSAGSPRGIGCVSGGTSTHATTPPLPAGAPRDALDERLEPVIGAAAAALAAKVRFHLEFPAFENNYRVETRSDAVRGDGFDAFDDGSLDRFEDINAERLVPPASVASSNAALTVASAFRRALDAAIAATPAKPPPDRRWRLVPVVPLAWHQLVGDLGARLALEMRAALDTAAFILAWLVEDRTPEERSEARGAEDFGRASDAPGAPPPGLEALRRRYARETEATRDSCASAWDRPTLLDAFANTTAVRGSPGGGEPPAVAALTAPFWVPEEKETERRAPSARPKSPPPGEEGGSRAKPQTDFDATNPFLNPAVAAKVAEDRARADAVENSRREAEEARARARAARELRAALEKASAAKSAEPEEGDAPSSSSSRRSSSSSDDAGSAADAPPRNQSQDENQDHPGGGGGGGGVSDGGGGGGGGVSDDGGVSDNAAPRKSDDASFESFRSAAALALLAEVRAAGLPEAHVPKQTLTAGQRLLGPGRGAFCASRFCARECVARSCAAFVRAVGSGEREGEASAGTDLARRLRAIAIRNHPDRNPAARVGEAAAARAVVVTQQATMLESMLRQEA